MEVQIFGSQRKNSRLQEELKGMLRVTRAIDPKNRCDIFRRYSLQFAGRLSRGQTDLTLKL